MPETNPPFSAARELALIWLLSGLAAIHVFIFSAAFPLFNNVDEQAHFDLIVKYAYGHVPSGLEHFSSESTPYIILYGSVEYLRSPTNFPDGKFPPPFIKWPQTDMRVRQGLAQLFQRSEERINHESSEPPLYYASEGLWWQLAKVWRVPDDFLIYSFHFINGIFVVGIVWLGYFAARLVFPENIFLRLGVPALLMAMPQTAFYSVNNDVLSPLCFGAAFIGLIQWVRVEIPGARLGIFTGLALAATFLAKTSNLPLIAVSASVVAFTTWRWIKAKKNRAIIPPLILLALGAVLPVIPWLIWCKTHFGDFTGSAVKIHYLGWTVKPFHEWWLHPMFTPGGLWVFLSGNLATFWQGEFLWHRQPLAWALVNLFYALISLLLIGAAIVRLCQSSAGTLPTQRLVLWFALASCAAGLFFFAFLSIIYDFHQCFYPSREHPYFTSGRLLLGALIPFMLLFVFGLDALLKRAGPATKMLVLAALILLMLGLEIAIDRPVFSSLCNWFHL